MTLNRRIFLQGTSRSLECAQATCNRAIGVTTPVALELGQLLKGSRITANALHPGVINTELDRNLKPITQVAFALLTKISGKTIEQGAATSCFVATSELLGSTSGRYFEDCNTVNVLGGNHLTDKPMADKLRFLSEELTSNYLVTPQLPTGSSE